MSNVKHNIPSRGFTLIEVIVVLVLLSIIGSIGSHFIVTAVDAYASADARQKLAQRARVTIEQLSRELRLAVPNSARVSASGNCIEFLPSIAAGFYTSPVATPSNAKAETSTVETRGLSAFAGVAKYAAISPFSSSELYSLDNPSAMAAVSSISTPPSATVILSAAHTFVRNSAQQRVFIAADPIRFCMSGDTLVRYSGYGLFTASLMDAPPGGLSSLMAHQVTSGSTAFALSPGSEDRNTIVRIDLQFSSAGEMVRTQHQVGIRNVP